MPPLILIEQAGKRFQHSPRIASLREIIEPGAQFIESGGQSAQPPFGVEGFRDGDFTACDLPEKISAGGPCRLG